MSLDADAISRIRQKLEKAGKTSFREWWWIGRRFKLNPTVPESEIVAFETLHNLRLPEDYRDCLIHLCDGGIGPPYGLHRFSVSTHQYDPGISRMWPGMPECIASEDSMDDDQGVDFDWTPFLKGTLPILSEGCSYRVHLMLNGPFKGRVIHLSDEVDGGPQFTWDTGFLPWLERWFDEKIEGLGAGGFSASMPGCPDRLWEIIQNPEVTPAELEAVLITLVRRPRFESRFTSVVAAAFSHFSEEVRIAACRVVHRHHLKVLEKYIFNQLDDPDSRVVSGALFWMDDIFVYRWVSRWKGKVRQLLCHDNNWVAYKAGSLLLKARVLNRADLLPLIDSISPSKRRIGIGFWGERGFRLTGEEWLERRLSDENLEVRRALILAASKAKDYKFLPIMREMPQQEGGEFEELVANVRVKLLLPVWQTWPVWLAALLISFLVPPQILPPIWGLALLISIVWRIWY
jgi:hypothetical protein